MNLKNLFAKLSSLAVLFAFMSASVFAADIYVDVTDGDDVFGDGSANNEYASISKAISVASDGDTIYIIAGEYDSGTTGAAGEDALEVAGDVSLTFIAVAEGNETVVTITNGIKISTSGVVSIGESGDAKFNLGTTADALNITDGTVNLGDAQVVIGAGGTLTIDGTPTLNGPVATGGSLNVTYTGAGSLNTADHFPASLATGDFTVDKSSGTLTVPQDLIADDIVATDPGTELVFLGNVAPGDVTVTTGDVTFQGDLTVAKENDVTNNGAGTLTIGSSNGDTFSLTSEGDDADEADAADVGQLINTAAGEIVVNAKTELNIKNTDDGSGAGDAFDPVNPIVSNTGAGTITMNGAVAVNNANENDGDADSNNDVSHSIFLTNAAGGEISIGAALTTPASADFNDDTFVNVQLVNATGDFTIDDADLRGATGTDGLVNDGGGTFNLGGNVTSLYDVSNDNAGSELNINGSLVLGSSTVASTFDNSGEVNVNNSSSVLYGDLTNDGTVALGSNTLTFEGESMIVIDNMAGAGDIISDEAGKVGDGKLVIKGEDAVIDGAGEYPSIDFNNADGASNEFRGGTINGNVVVATGGTTLTFDDAATTIEGNYDQTTADVVLDEDLTVKGNFTMNGASASFDFGVTSNTLTVGGNFTKTEGEIGDAEAGDGTLLFNGGADQTFFPGVLMYVYNFELNNASLVNLDPILLTLTGTLRVNNDFTITNGQLAIGEQNIRMLQAGGSARFTNDGAGYTSEGVGGIVFEGDGDNAGGAGDGSVITGTEPFSNIWVRLTTNTNNIYCLGSVTISGTLALQSGGVTWNQADDGGDLFTASSLTLDQSLTSPDYPTVIVDTDNNFADDVMLDGADGGADPLDITTKYNLEYEGGTSRSVGGEFIAADIYGLSVKTTGSNTIDLNANTEIAGPLYVASTEILDLDTFDLEASGDDVTHTVMGTVTDGDFIISGDGQTLNGSSDDAHEATIAELTLATGATNLTGANLQVITTLDVDGADVTATITMNDEDATVGDVTVDGGTVTLDNTADNATLTGPVAINDGTFTLIMGEAGQNTVDGNTTIDGGTFVLGSDLIFGNGAGDDLDLTDGDLDVDTFNAYVTEDFSRIGTGQVLADGGYFVAYPKKGNGDKVLDVDADDFTIPNFQLGVDEDPNDDDEKFTVATSGFEVTNSFHAVDGTLDIVTFDIDFSGATFTYDGGTFEATTGIFEFSNDDVTATLSGNSAIPNVTISTGPTTFTIASNDDTQRTFIVTNEFVLNTGNVDINGNVISLTETGGADANFTSNANAGTITGGFLGFDGTNDDADLDNAAPLTIEYLRIGTATTKDDDEDAPLTVSNLLDLDDDFTINETAQFLLGDGAWVRRSGGTLDKMPTFGTSVNNEYDGAVTTGVELPTTDILYDLVIDAGGTVVLGADAEVNKELDLQSGTFELDDNTLTVEDSATVKRSAGTFGAGDDDFPTFAGFYFLVFNNTADLTTDNEFSADGNLDLSVESDGADVDLHANRTVNNFTMNGDDGDEVFDLDGNGLTVNGLTTITSGSVENGDLNVFGNVEITGGDLGTDLDLTFLGSSNQELMLPGNEAIGSLTLNQDGTDPVPYVNVTGGDLTIGGVVNFNNGLLMMNDNTIILPTAAGTGQSFNHNVTAPELSHVVGNVLADVKVGTNNVNGRTEFPVGSAGYYRPASLTLIDQNIGPALLGVEVTINHQDDQPTGLVGLPIDDISRYPDFFWNISSNVSFGSQKFDLELTAAGFDDFDDIANVVILRRQGTADDVENTWLLQGQDYDNFLSGGVPNVVNTNSVGGIRPENAIFTYGITTNLTVDNPLPNLEEVFEAGKQIIVPLGDVFGGNSGEFVYSATSTNPNVATVPDGEIEGDSLVVDLVSDGEVIITVRAQDENRDFITDEFSITAVLTDVEGLDELPTEFSLEQNYPNPFNPATVIRYGLPKESNVVLKVYNVLGEEVRTLINTVQTAGWHEVNFDASQLTSGLYIYRIEATDFVEIKKMMLIK